MKTLNSTERGLIAALAISDIVSVLLVLYNILYTTSGERDMIPIFLMLMPAVYLETKRKLQEEENQTFRYKNLLRVLLSCLIITESMNLILLIL
jgi:hypothetical protein